MRTRLHLIVIGVLCLLMLVGSASADQPVLQPGATSTAGVVPVVITGNPQTCEELGCTGTAVKIDKSGETQTPDLYDGVYSLGSQTITIDATTYNLIAWSATTRINCIYMKGANGGDLYSYCFDPPISSDSGLTTPVNAAGTPADISHIIICYTPGLYPPPPDVPEFPSIALPVGMIISIIGLVYFIKSREK